jgi:hypothetical protein
MKPETNRTRPRIVGITVVVALGLVLAACSKSATSTPTGPTGTTAPAATTPAATTAAVTTPPSTSSESPSSSPAAGGDLTGKWTGQYSGAFKGTFTLNWTQTGSKLKGSINLSTSGTLPINGTVDGSAIHFGTVGSTDITYTGSVSGDSMSGSYQVHTPNGAVGGPWSATRS